LDILEAFQSRNNRTFRPEHRLDIRPIQERLDARPDQPRLQIPHWPDPYQLPVAAEVTHVRIPPTVHPADERHPPLELGHHAKSVVHAETDSADDRAPDFIERT